MNEGISSRLEERLKRLLDKIDIPPPVPEKSASAGTIPTPEPFPQEIVRTFYPGLNLLIHSEMPKTSTLPAVSIPIATEDLYIGKITLYKTDKPLQEHEKTLIETVLKILASHLGKLVRQPEMLNVSVSTKQGEKRPFPKSIIEERGYSFWNHEIAPLLSSIPSTLDPLLTSLEYQDDLAGQIHLSLQGIPGTQEHGEFLRGVLSTLQEHLISLSYQQFSKNLLEQQLSWENALEKILHARSPADVLTVFCEIISSTAKAYLLHYIESSGFFEISSQWSSRPQSTSGLRQIVADPILQVITHPEKILQISSNTETPGALRELKNFLSPEEHLLVIPLISGETPEGCILLMSTQKPVICEEDERKLLHLAGVASLVLHRLTE